MKNYWEIYRDHTMNPRTGLGVQELEIHVGAETSTLYAYQAHHSGTFERICKIIEADATHGHAELLRELAHRSGHVVVELEGVTSKNMTPMHIVSATLQAASTAIHDYNEAWADGEITVTERELVSAAIDQAIEELQRAKMSLADSAKDPRQELKQVATRKFDSNGVRI